MKLEIGNWLTATDIKTGRLNERKELVLSFENEGEYIENKFNEGKKKFKISVAFLNLDDEVQSREWTMNWTTQKRIISAYGDDTKLWVGKPCYVWSVPSMIDGKMTSVLYGRPEEIENVKLVP